VFRRDVAIQALNNSLGKAVSIDQGAILEILICPGGQEPKNALSIVKTTLAALPTPMCILTIKALILAAG
jgi:hypothetical protein